MTEDWKFDLKLEEKSLKISFSTTMENIDKADFETRKFLKSLGLESELFSVSLVMREALTNAVRHGNQYDFNKMINYSISFDDSTLIIDVEDEGNGFNWRSAQDKEPDPTCDHGRGIIIMRQYFTDYNYNEKGNKLQLIKKIENF
ncbi:MAG: ATP-binding protein [Desulfobacterales bacterium]|nr:ATP-binding protein [Desulfobacterales bacterium]MBF0396245.1 ATP-binding protein [Desulfobacterales bacterium]